MTDDRARDECEHGSLRRACPICERDADIADLWNALDQSRAERDSLRAERDALKQTVHDELDANLRLREIGGAQPDEGMTTFLERVFSERDSLRAELAAVLAPHTVVHEVLVEQLGEKGAAAVTHAARAHVAALEALHAEVERLRVALMWYADEARTLGKSVATGVHTNAVLASVTVLAADAGSRAEAAMRQEPKA